MTTFVQAGSAAGILFLPRDVVGPVPVKDGPFRDTEVLSLPGWQVAELDDANDLLDIVRAARRRRAATDAIEYQAIARLAQLRAAEGKDRYVPDEVALESRIGTGAAANRVATATALVQRMPLALAAMQDGEFEGYLASRLADATQALTDADAREVDRLLAGKLATGRVDVNDPKNVRDACRRLVLKVNPDAATTKARIARCERKVQLMPGEDTMSRIIGDLPAEVAASAYARIDRIARRLRNNGDERTLDQLRADVFGDLLTGTEPDGSEAGGTGTAGAIVYVHMPVDTALAMSDDGAELTGYGPLPGPIARDIMTRKHSVLRKLLVDPGSGKIEGLGRRRYRPNQALRDLIIARDRECPFCHRPAQFCDIDHLDEWVKDRGGTDPANLDAKCERHHYLKDADGWDLHVDVDTGVATVITPAGRTYTRRPDPIIEPQPPPEPPPVPEPPSLNDDPPF